MRSPPHSPPRTGLHQGMAARHCLGTVAASLALVSALLPGCAQWPDEANARFGSDAACGASKLSPADNTRLASIDQLIGEGKFYAALAQLDALGATSEQALLTRAEALRRIDRNEEALAIYRKLAGGCLNGRAQHGLGLLAARQGRQADALTHLRLARQLMPTDLNVRNDLGYALLLAGQLDAAQFEFLTVLDLSPGDSKAGRNLVMLTFRQGQIDKAQELGRKMGLDAATVSRLQLQALTLPGGGTALPPVPHSAPGSAPISAAPVSAPIAIPVAASVATPIAAPTPVVVAPLAPTKPEPLP
jgi:Flp pilus assembly protein TadD